MVQSLHFFKPGQDVTCIPTTDVEGARFVTVTEGGTYNRPHIAYAAADALTFGVTARDAKADEPVLTHTGGIVPVTAGEAVKAGDTVFAGADGKAVTTGTVARGIAIADAASGELASVHML